MRHQPPQQRQQEEENAASTGTVDRQIVVLFLATTQKADPSFQCRNGNQRRRRRQQEGGFPSTDPCVATRAPKDKEEPWLNWFLPKVLDKNERGQSSCGGMRKFWNHDKVAILFVLI